MPEARRKTERPSAAPNFPLITRSSQEKDYPGFTGVHLKSSSGPKSGSKPEGTQRASAATPVPGPLDVSSVTMREAATRLSETGRAGRLYVLLGRIGF